MRFWPKHQDDAGDSSDRGLSHDGAIYPSSWQLLAPYFAEFVGTFVLTVTFMCNYNAGNSDITWATTSNAFMMMCMVYAFGHISGASFNPSVCIALWLSGRYQATVCAKFCLVQIAGAICAGFSGALFQSTDIDLGPREGYGWTDVLIVEALYSGLICFVYLNCAASMRSNPPGDWNGFVGIAVGFCFIAGGYASKEVANTVFNSAISMGLCIADSNASSFWSWASVGYFLYDLLGAVIGAGLYRIVRPQESMRQLDPRGGEAPPSEPTMTSCVAAELIGTYYVVITKALNRLDESDTVGYEAWSVAAAISAMVYSLKDLSGAYFNPAITVSVLASRRGSLELRVGVFYTMAQVFAGVMASSTYALIRGGVGIQITFGSRYPPAAVAMAELLFSLIASYAVLTTGLSAREVFGRPTDREHKCKVTKTRQNNIAGLAYGACHIVGGFSIGNVSGSILNPAVALGFSGLEVLASGFHNVVIQYVLYEVAGGLVATALFFVTHVHLYQQEKPEVGMMA